MKERFSLLEFVVVIAVAFGTSMLASVADLLAGRVAVEGGGSAFGAGHVQALIAYQLLALPVLCAILYAGGWRRRDFRVNATAAATLMGVCIGTGMLGADWLLSQLLQLASPSIQAAAQAWNDYRPAHPAGLGAILALAVVNPLFEELFACAYVVEALESRFGEGAAANVSIAIRTTYHFYQGALALPFHIAYGFVQAYVYLRFRSLWLLIVSHALLDFVALALLTH